MKKTALVIMAAGIGSRYGAGIKQLAKVGPSGEIIIDYSIHDALKAGFNKIVFIIRKDIEKEFKEVIGERIEKIADVSYAYQELTDLPDGYSIAPERTKPLGTAQAIWAARDVIDCPFIVINADDYYGPHGFEKIHDYLVNEMDEDGDILDMCMAGYVLKNTLSKNGKVARGVCREDENGMLLSVNETYQLGRDEDGKVYGENGKQEKVEVAEDSLVSMNMWGLPQKIVSVFGEGFPAFLDSIKEGDIKSEYLLPREIDRLIQSGKGSVKVLPTDDKWFGVTFQEDRQYVVDSIRKMVDEGFYGEKLFG